MSRAIPLAVLLALAAAAHADSSLPPAAPPGAAQPRRVRLPSGLEYVDLRVGTGPTPTRGDRVTAHYVGTFPDGRQFDSSRDRRAPFEYVYGIGHVIRGWEEGLTTMRVGGLRRLIIPPALAYGDRGAGGGRIPPGATLVFDVELLALHPPVPVPRDKR